ncbi:hypothetical protein PBAL39_05508 [Pedobacter sp. BAL39]|nr:hypothetical protein PBAL39_05508 [Pedobacter sp. BAL39]
MLELFLIILFVLAVAFFFSNYELTVEEDDV